MCNIIIYLHFINKCIAKQFFRHSDRDGNNDFSAPVQKVLRGLAQLPAAAKSCNGHLKCARTFYSFDGTIDIFFLICSTCEIVFLVSIFQHQLSIRRWAERKKNSSGTIFLADNQTQWTRRIM